MKLPLTIGAKVASAIYDADGVLVCIIDSMQEASRSEEVEIARRIVACVNACAGIPTDKLEEQASDPIAGMFGRLASKAVSYGARLEEQRDSLTAQRDELLASLEKLIGELDKGDMFNNELRAELS